MVLPGLLKRWQMDTGALLKLEFISNTPHLLQHLSSHPGRTIAAIPAGSFVSYYYMLGES